MFTWSGLFLALGFLTIQKLVYAFPGLAIGTCWYVFTTSDQGDRRLRFAHVAYQLVGFCAPLVLTAIYLQLYGALTDFIHYNFCFYLGVRGFTPYKNLENLLYQNPLFGFFGSAGLLYTLPHLFRRSSPSLGSLITLATIALLVGLFLIPVPHFQYFVLFMPLGAIFAASFLVNSVTKLAEMRNCLTVWQWISVAAMSSIILLGGLISIAHGTRSYLPPLLVVGYWFGLYLVTMVFAFRRKPILSLVLFLVGMSLGSMKRLQSAITSPDPTPQIEEISYIIKNTDPTDTIMDGFQGSGLYRPHAYYYWFLPYNDRERLTAQEKEQLLHQLNGGSIAPKLILVDKNLSDISPAITEFFDKYYKPVGIGVIWKRTVAAGVDQTLSKFEPVTSK
jgi:hypothetical protein